jgi:mono/diheme cytochrome c family protein
MRTTIVAGFIGLYLLFGQGTQGWSQGPAKGFQEGKKLYESHCADCHRINGQGLPVKFPALDKNRLVTGYPVKLIDLVLNGRKGALGLMPGWKETFKNQEVASILTYIRQAWSNQAPAVLPETVKKRRK